MHWLDNTHQAPDLGGTITYAGLLDQTSTLHVVAIGVMLIDPITRPAHFGGLFCGNTPDVALGQTLQGGFIKKEGFPSPSPVRRSFPLF